MCFFLCVLLLGVGESETNGKGYFFGERKDDYYDGIIVVIRGTGFWKPIENEVPVFSSELNKVVGTRRTLVFSGDDLNETQWFMDEIRLLPPNLNGPTPFPQEVKKKDNTTKQ